MKLQSFCAALGLTTFAFILGTSPSFSQDNASANQPDKVTFLCASIYDNPSGQRIPATVAWNPQRKTHVRVIGWKSEYFEKGGWTPQKRCQVVSEKFQKFYEAGRLDYLKTGTSRGYPVICAPKTAGGNCNGDNQLFTIKFGSNPDLVWQQLVGIFENNGNQQGTVINQVSGGGKTYTYVSVDNLLKYAPPVNVEK